ncbi:MAG: hypothetical protein WA461_08530 [Nitrososphaeraceae archaeon]
MRRALFSAIFGIAVFLLSVDSIIGYVSDFLVGEITSNFGISLFVLISAVFIIASFVIFQLIKITTSEVRNNSKELRVLHGAAFTTQLLLIAVVAALLIQIVFMSEYYTAFPITIAALSPLTAAFGMIMSCSILITWFRFNRGSYVVLIFALAFSINAYVFIYTSFASIYHLIEKGTVITPESEVIYPTDLFQAGSIQRILSDTYKFAATANFVMLLAGSAIMLRHYSAKIGRIKFWIMVLVPSIYYISILLDALGIYVPESETELFNYYIYASLNGIIGGVLLGLLFWSISRTMKPNKAVMNYLLLCSYGLVLLSIATVGQVSVAAFPPFGIAAFSMLPLSSYMIILGLCSAATSISQDIRLREYIKDLCKADSGFLSTIGEAQLEKKVQTKASDLENVVKEQRVELEKKSGIESSIQEQDIKQYLLEVLQEVDRHKSSP